MMCKIRQILIITEIILKVEIYIKIITITNNNNEQFIEYFDFYKLRVLIFHRNEQCEKLGDTGMQGIFINIVTT